MDETAIQRVVNFSSYLKNSADIILEKAGTVSIDTWTLYEMEEAFSLIFEVEKYTNFHVLPPNNRQHPAIPQIQFLYDILQKIKNLRIISKPDQILPQEQQINLKCFRSLYSLELDLVPIHQLKGLQNLRPILKQLTVKGVCSQMSEILLKCGADKSTEYAWENLQFANFSRNHLYTLDNSLKLLTAAKILNLSYCQLKDASALICLPNISYLDLSYNQLTFIPALSENAACSLVSINLSNNLVVDLRGVSKFSNLEELNLKENFLSVEQTLFHLKDLPHLRYLNLLRNPITYSLNYRLHVIQCLNPAIQFCEKFYFDELPLLVNEQNEIGSPAHFLSVSSSSSQLIKFLTEKITNWLKPSINEGQVTFGIETSSCNLTSPIYPKAEVSLYECSPSSTTHKVHAKKRSCKKQTRHISITDHHESLECSLSHLSNSSTLASPKSSPLEQERLLNSSSNLFDPRLHEAQVHCAQESVLRAPKVASPLPDKLLEEILNSHSVAAEIDSDEHSLLGNDWDLVPAPRTRATSSSSSSLCPMNEQLSRPILRDLSPISTDDEELEPHRELVSVMARWEGHPSEVDPDLDSDFLFASFSPYFYKEKDGLSGATVVKLNISSLQSIEVLSETPPCKVALHFNYLNPELRSRILFLEEDDLVLLKELVEPIIALNHQEEKARSTPPFCSDCGLPFYGLMARHAGLSRKTNKYCRSCGNKKRRLSSTNGILNKTNAATASLASKPLISSDLHSHRKLTMDIGSAPVYQQTHCRQKSNAQSSDSSESVSVCDSDISAVPSMAGTNLEHRSSPSMSSIEVLSERPGTDSDERSSLDFEMPVSAVLNLGASTSLHPELLNSLNRVDGGVSTKREAMVPLKEPTLMQESSSSGSMTGSVCTAVDRLSSGSNTPLKARLQDAEVRQPLVATSVTPSTNNTEDIPFLSTSAKSTDTICHSVPTSLREALQVQLVDSGDTKGIIFEDSNKVSLERWSKNLQVCYTSYSIEWWEEVFEDAVEELSAQNESTSITFNFDDFSIVDHRVKLFCEVFLFKEKQELLQGLVKAIATVDNGKPFLCLVVISNRKVYVLRIKRCESNSPQDWLEMEMVCFLDEVPAICTLFQKQGLLLHLRERFILVCLADAQRTSAVFSFILGCIERFGFHPRVDNHSSQLQSQSLRRHVPLDDNGQEPTIHLFQMVTLLSDGGECTNHFLVLTTSHVVLLEADLTWLVSSTSQEITSSDDVTLSSPDLIITSCYSLDDVTQIDVFSDTLIKVEFYQQSPNATRPPWTLHLASSWATCNLIHTLRPLWMHLLKIDLALVCFSEDLCIVRDLLRETSYGKYLNSN